MGSAAIWIPHYHHEGLSARFIKYLRYTLLLATIGLTIVLRFLALHLNPGVCPDIECVGSVCCTRLAVDAPVKPLEPGREVGQSGVVQ